jgi:hypothetical protein
MDVAPRLTTSLFGKGTVGKHAVVGERRWKTLRHCKQEDRRAITESVSSVSHIGLSANEDIFTGKAITMHNFWIHILMHKTSTRKVIVTSKRRGHRERGRERLSARKDQSGEENLKALAGCDRSDAAGPRDACSRSMCQQQTRSNTPCRAIL